MSGEEEEKTETIYGVENGVSVSLQCFARVKVRHDTCGDYILPSVIVTTEPIKNAYRGLLRIGIKTRSHLINGMFSKIIGLLWI